MSWSGTLLVFALMLGCCLSQIKIKQENKRNGNSYNSVYCSFEKDTCAFTLHDDSSNHILITKMHRSTDHSGPISDRTFGTPKTGGYIGVSSEGSHSYRSTAPERIGTMTSHETPAGVYCLNFFSSMYGADVGDVNVYLKYAGNNEKTLVTLRRQNDRDWRLNEVQFTATQAFQVSFEFTLPAVTAAEQRPMHIEAAIDDLYLSDVACANVAKFQRTPHMFVSGDVTSYYDIHYASTMSWQDAYTECRKKGPRTFLASIESAAEQSFLEGVIEANDNYKMASINDGFYTSSINDFNNRTEFYWTDNQYRKLSYTNWMTGSQPSFYYSYVNRHCVFVDDGHKWDVDNCKYKKSFICETQVDKDGSPLG